MVDMNLLIRNIVEEFEAAYQYAFQIQMDLAEEVIIFSDKKMLYSIISNLISNAIKYSIENKKIEVKMIVSKTDGKVIIQIKDHGIGMSDETKTHLFERFYRSESSKNISGTGLGLNIVKNYVDLLKGEIQFESVLNKGTEVKIIL
jgi:signal transduction histidine kinase